MKISRKQTVFLIISLIFLLGFSVSTYGVSVNYARQDSIGHKSLIPLPQMLKWTNESFKLSQCRWIQIKDKTLLRSARTLQDVLALKGFHVKIKYGEPNSKELVIHLKLETVLTPLQQKEAYQLKVNKHGVQLMANTAKGIFNGIQSLSQLFCGEVAIPGCEITDYPSYEWRGYMLDVARNYQTIDFIKQQIDIMSKYKLNVFHFHVTDNPAWRLQIKKYPQLTAAEHMMRDKGKYYTIDQIQDLIRYCQDRYITFVPEIDVPGHSDAFKRAMGTDMQSSEGLAYVKDIFHEICKTYDLPYIHIGADEVKIHNLNFLTEVTQVIQQYNKQVVGWNPGGKYDDSVIQQLWVEEAGKLEQLDGSSIRYLDSRHFYLNHMDPQNSVVNIFNRQIGSKTHGNVNLLGAELCMWTDRILNSQETMPVLNPLYPGMLAFAERIWRGGGYPGVTADMGSDTSLRAKEFKAFEARLIAHKEQYFRQLPFPYVKQSHMRWKLFGPFGNKGVLTSTFWPEQQSVSLIDSSAAERVTGATIFLKHFFAPEISSWLKKPEAYTTWYAYTRFQSDSDKTLMLWLGTKDISRSHADDSPPPGGWDYLGSVFYLNKKVIPAPNWARAGKDGGLDIPLTDEGYTYRKPTVVKVKKGWNEILVKLPVGSFKGRAWDHPVKWMFTLVPVHKDKQGINWVADDILFSP